MKSLLIPHPNRIFWVVSVPLALFAWIWFMTSLPTWLNQTRKDLKDPQLAYWKFKMQYLKELARATVGREVTADTIPGSMVMERRQTKRHTSTA